MTDKFNPLDYYSTLQPPKAVEKAPESPQGEELSPSGTTRGISKERGEKARIAAMKDINNLLGEC